MNVLPRYAKLPVSTPVAILSIIVLMLMLGLQGGITSTYIHVFLLLSNYLVWGVMLPFIQGLVQNVSFRQATSIVFGLAAMTLLLIIHFLISNVFYYLLQYLFAQSYQGLPSLTEIKGFILPSMFSRMVDFTMFFGLLSWANQNRKLADKQVELANKEALLQKSKSDSLRSQLNPHFLFNTLHAISSLIGIQDDRARGITIKISSLLRKTLQANERKTHSLSQELDLIEEYLDIEVERFNDRLEIKKAIDTSCDQVSVPSMIFQPLIENAFKHGVSIVEGKAAVSIEMNCNSDFISFTVINDINPDESSKIPSNGIGLSNLQERLHLHYGDKFDLQYKSQQGQFHAHLKLPKT